MKEFVTFFKFAPKVHATPAVQTNRWPDNACDLVIQLEIKIHPPVLTSGIHTYMQYLYLGMPNSRAAVLTLNIESYVAKGNYM